MTSWDRYRGGLEYFLYIGIKRGNIRNTRENYLEYEEKCRKFALQRMAVAIRFWVARRDFIKAYELYTRMVIGGMGNHPEIVPLRDTLPLNVAIQTLVFQVNATAGITRLILADLADPKGIADILRREGLDQGIEITLEPPVHEPERLEKTSVFHSDPSLRQKFETLGYKPNLIFSDSDLIQYVLM
jgi:hypothetical protein